MGIKQAKKNRYKKKKPPAKSRIGSLRQGIRMLFKSTFLALMIVGMSLVFIFIHDVLTQCDYFEAKTITVTGTNRLAADDILAIAEIGKGVNLVSMNLKTVREKLLAHPWIAQADICRTFPGDIAINICEEQPLAILDFGKQFLINKDGVIFKEVQAEEFPGMPVLTGIEYGDWPAFGRSSDTPPTPVFVSVMEILSVSGSMEGVPGQRIKKILVDREMGLTLETDGPVRRVTVGYGDYLKKLDRLEKILVYLARDENLSVVDTMDLRNPERVVARPGKEQLSEKDQKEV